MITVAREAIAISDPKHNRIQLTLHDYCSHEMGKDRVANDYVRRPSARRCWMPRRRRTKRRQPPR